MLSIDTSKMILGAAQNFENICWIYPLKIKDIIAIGEEKYSEYLGLLTIDRNRISKELKEGNIKKDLNFSPLEYLLINASLNNTFLVELQKAFSTFIREEVHFLPKQKEIVIGEDFVNKRTLNNENFEDFQNILRAQNKLTIIEPVPKKENPMEKKFRLRREQVAEAKRKEAMKNGEVVTISDSISTLICLNVGVTFENVGELTVYQFQEILARAQMKYKYDMDLRLIAAGANPDKIKPKKWFGKIK